MGSSRASRCARVALARVAMAMFVSYDRDMDTTTTPAPAPTLVHRGFSSASSVIAYGLAGKATVTLESAATGSHYTYRITRCAGDKGDLTRPWFVSVRSGSEFHFLGTVFADGQYRHGRKSRIPEGAPSARAWAWAWARIMGDSRIPPQLRVHHEGRCGRCGRALTTPESIAAGLGPVCRGA